MHASYRRGLDGGEPQNTVSGGLRSRHYLGRSIALCVGADGDIGGSDAGLVYEAELYLAGVALPLGDEGVASLCGGAGLSGVRGALPFAWQVPLEASVELQLGPVRALAWSRLRWILGEEARAGGSATVSFADEFDVGIGVRLGSNSRYWHRVSGGHGPFLGLSYRERGGAELVGVVLGLALWGADR